MDIVDKFYNVLRTMVARYDDKKDPNRNNIFICKEVNTRNRYKREEYKISEGKPQCPIYKDNRCCGGCKLARTCDHCVDCNCYGYTYSTIGGTEIEMNHKASIYYGCSRLKEDGTFDWDYYMANKKK